MRYLWISKHKDFKSLVFGFSEEFSADFFNVIDSVKYAGEPCSRKGEVSKCKLACPGGLV